MAISPIAATPPSLAPIPSIETIRAELLVGSTESSLLGNNVFPLTDSVEISAAGSALSAAAGIADAADQGTAIDTAALVDNVQSFVDNVNVVNSSNQFALSDLLNTEIVPAATTPQAEALASVGISVLPAGADGSSFILSLDTTVLESALASNPSGTAQQLANATAPIAAAVAAQSSVSAVLAGDLTQDALATTLPSNAQLTPELLSAISTASDGVGSVVPDLTVDNAELRRALAVTLLDDAVNAAANIAEAEAAALTAETEQSEQDAAATVAAANATVTASIVDAAAPAVEPAAPATPVTTPLPVATAAVGTNATTSATSNTAAPQIATADVQAQATPTNILPTPLEQTALLSANPTLAGAVSAFQIPAGDGNWAARTGVQGDLDMINPAAAIRQAQAIAPNLANNNNERQEGAAEYRLSQALAGRLSRRAIRGV